jgi:hypothetical protein
MSAPTINDAVNALSKLEPERQKALASYIQTLEVDVREPESIDAADIPFVLEGLEQASRGEFGMQEEVEATFRSFALGSSLQELRPCSANVTGYLRNVRLSGGGEFFSCAALRRSSHSR